MTVKIQQETSASQMFRTCDLTLVEPTPADFQGMAVLQSSAFAEDGFQSISESQSNNFKTYQRYQKECPMKLTHCRIIKSPDNDGTILAACQLHLRRAKQAEHETDVFVEWIACHPDYRNHGIGSLLLAWASTFARQELHAKTLSLYVVKSNKGAVRLYQRRGFMLQQGGKKSNALSKLHERLSLLLCFACDRWTILTMEKDLYEGNP